MLCAYSGFSQIMISSLHKPSSMTICEADSTFSLLVANTSGSTVSGAILTVDLPTSCLYIPGSIANASELDISNLNQPTFTLPNILNNTSHGVDFNSEIVCGYDNTEDFNYFVNYNSSVFSGFDTPLQNYYYPSIVITNITNSSATVQINQSVVRDFTIEQQGLFASVDTLVVIDEHTNDIDVLSVNIGILNKDLGPGPILRDTIIITGSDLPGGNNKFDYGESIVLSETVVLIGCNNGESTINATWGCYGDYCEDHFAYPSVSPASGVPLINMDFTGNKLGWGFIDNSGFFEFTISNNGTGAGTAYDLVALAGFSSGGGTYYPNGNWLNEVDSFSVNGNYLKSFYNYASGAINGRYSYYFSFNYTFDPDGPGVGIEDEDGDGIFDDLPVGNTITLKAHTYYNWQEAQANIPIRNNCGRGWTDNRWQAFRFGFDLVDQCSNQSGATWVPNTNTLLFHTYNTKTLEHIIPADIYDGATVWMEQQVTTNTKVDDDGCPNDSVIYTVTLPDGVVIAGGTATYRGISMGTPQITGNTAVYFLNKNKVKYGGWFKVPLQTDCNSSHNPTATISTNLKFWCDKSLYPSRFFTYWCSETPVFGIQCPPIGCLDPYVSDFSIERTTLGWKDSQLSEKVDKETPGLQLDYAMARDSIKIVTKGTINELSDSVYYILHHDNIPGSWSNNMFFDYLTDTLEFYDFETDNWITCAGLNPTISNAQVSELVLNISDLTLLGGCFSGYTFTAGDSLIYSIYGQVRNVAKTQWETVPALRSHFYNIKNNKDEYCNDRGATFNILGSNLTFSKNTWINPTLIEGCDDLQFYGEIYRWLDDCGGIKAFPNEVRPYVVMDSLIFLLPEKIDYHTGTSVHRYRDKDGIFEIEPIADPIIEYTGGVTKLIYVRDASWSYSAYSDCSSDQDRVQFYATASCIQDPTIDYSISTKGRYQFYADGQGIDQSGTDLASKQYLSSDVVLTPLITTAEGRYDTVTWDVRLCNVTNIDANNNWLAFECESEGIEVIEIVDVTVPTNPSTLPVTIYGQGKSWAQLGDFISNQCNIYQVKAIYSSCSTDSLYLRHSFNCTGYPVNPELGYLPTAYSCNENNTFLYLEPNDVSLNLSLTSPVNPLLLCDTLVYGAEVSNTLLSYAYNLLFTVTVPPGVSIVPDSSEFSFPYNSGNFNIISDPQNIPIGSNNWIYNISADPNAIDILKGIDSLPNNGYKLRFKVITDCNLISGSSIKMTATASNACGSIKSRSSYSSPIIIDGLPTNLNLYVLSTETNNFLPTCDVGSTIKTKIINLGPNSASDIELLSISIDDAYDYLLGSLIPIHNGPSGIANNVVFGGVRFIQFAIQPNLSINDSIVFTYDLIDVDPGSLECDTIPLTTNAMLVASVPCINEASGSCEIQSITSSLVNNMTIRKDDVVFGHIIANSVRSGSTSELINIEYSLINSGSHPFNSDSLEVVFVHDANGNGIADESGADSLFSQKVGVDNIAVGDSVVSIAAFNASYDKVCNMLASIRLIEDTCICSETAIDISSIVLENTGPDTSVCVQNSLQLGFDTIQGQSYTWVPSAYLNSSSVSNPEFYYTGNLSEPDTLTYILITNRIGGCINQDSVDIIVYPFAEVNAGSDESICESNIYDFSSSSSLPVASNYDSITWYGGLGSFNNTHVLYPIYTPGNGELGPVELFIIAYSKLNCSQDISSMILTIDTLPEPDFTKIPDDNICVNELVSFSGIVSNNINITNWLWDFGDGNLSTGQYVNHHYSQDGQFDITLYLTSDNGCVDSIAKSISVNELPIAEFITNPSDTACAEQIIAMDASSTTNILNWNWNFGDLQIGSGQNTTHIYNISGNYIIQLIVENDNTCVDTVIDSIYIRELPVASINISQADTTCLNDSVFFEGISSNNIVLWIWDFGDGSSGSGQLVSHVYSQPGLYYYQLIIDDFVGCADTIIDSIYIRLPQIADFTINPSDTSCINELVVFYGNSTDNIVDWNWEFGDGNSDNGQTVSHPYLLPGTYDASLIFTDENGCIDTVTHQVIIDDPVIDFNMSPSPICFGGATTFTSTGDNITYAPYNWDFGDGVGTDIGYNSTYAYSQPGTYFVTLNVCSIDITQPYTVNPVCDVEAGGHQATCQDVYFNYATSLTPPIATGYSSIMWTTSGIGFFDDPTLVTPTYFPHTTEGAIQNDTIHMMMVGYGIPPCDNDTSYMDLIVIPGAYAQAGSDENSCIDEPYDLANSTDSAFATNYVSVYWLTDGLGYFNDPLIMRPIYIPGPGELGPVTLTMVATNIINCDSIDEMILTIYPKYVVPVDITVCYYDSIFAEGEWHHSSDIFYDTLQSNVGCDSVIITNLIVRPKIDKSFVISSGDSICRNEIIDYIPVGSANITNQLWDFGDGNTSISQNPMHSYQSPGNYRVVYYYTDINGCSDSAYRDISVFELPDIDFEINMDNGCVDFPVGFAGISTSNIVNWEWNFGDGTVGNGQFVDHVYNDFGIFTITLTITDHVGCSETISKSLLVLQASNAEFTHSFFACDSVQFIDLSTTPVGYNIVMWYWDFDDGDTSNLQNPVHVFPTNNIPGGVTYNVSLIITSDSSGYMCSNSVSHQVHVNSNPDIFFTWDPEPTCLGDVTSFYGGSGFPISQWHWDFGDGHFSTLQNSSHVFANMGSYVVELSIIDANGCINSMTNDISIVPLPEVSFTMSDSVICRQSFVSFTSTASPGINNWYWDFGDGSFSTDPNPVHYYGATGTFVVHLVVSGPEGCSASTSDVVLIIPEPTAEFTHSNINCGTVLFIDQSTAPTGYFIVEWLWDFGDGFSSTVQNPAHAYTDGAGIYDVELICTSDSAGFSCTDTITHTVVTPALPTVFIVWTPIPTTMGTPTNFFGTSGNVITSWYWDFGDGHFATTQNPVHIYDNSGIYNVVLTVTDIDGCENSTSIQVTIISPPDLDYSWDQNCLNEPVQFTVLSPPTNIPAVVSWTWDFGDGGISNEMNPVHVYSSPGTYNVSLSIVDIISGTNTVVKQITINQLPISSFDFESPMCVNVDVQFNDHSTTSTGSIVRWTWDFGDGEYAKIVSPGNPDVAHSYTAAGSYNVTLTVVNSDSCEGISQSSIVISEEPLPLFDFTSSCAGNPVTFTNQSMENGGGPIVNFLWNFGDPGSGSENISILPSPEHVYNMAGDYDVTLTISNSNGCTNSTISTVTVIDQPTLDFTFTESCMGDDTEFNSESDSQVITYAWTFGDGGTSDIANPTHSYVSSGDYTVTLIILTSDSCSAMMSHVVSVNPLPAPNFDNTSPACLNEEVVFTNLSTSPNGIIETWVWDFGDGANTTINAPDNPNVTHSYTADGTYSVILTVTDILGCESEIIKDVEIESNPIADFSYDETCFNEPVLFTDLSTENGGSDIQNWLWYFGNPASGPSNTSNLQDPTHIFTDPGTYNTSLIVTSTAGCSDTVEQEIVVDSLPSVNFTMAEDSICLGDMADFTGVGGNIGTWYWEFGDGGTSIEQNPSYLYASPGLYTVTLTGTESGSDGCQSAVSHQIMVNGAPEANFEFINNCKGDSTYFTDLSFSLYGFIVAWEWEFGDGNTSFLEDPVHLYANNNSYEVTLMVFDNYGCSDTLVMMIQVFDTPQPALSWIQGCEPEGIVNFTDESLPGGDGSPIVGWNWNFGEGNNYSTEVNPSYTYTKIDTCYLINLTVTDENGCSASDTSTVCLFGPTQMDFASTTVCFGQKTFFNVSTIPGPDSIATYTWNFNDGSTQQITEYDTISHIFLYPGKTLVELIVTDTTGCNSSLLKEIIVDSLPVSAFINTTVSCGDSVEFTDISSDYGSPIETWRWEFGDAISGANNTSNEQHPGHIYGLVDSTYFVNLITSNLKGCTDTITKSVFVEPCLIAAFKNDISTCSRSTDTIIDTSLIYSNNGVIDYWYWDMGDGTILEYNTYVDTIYHTFSSYGTYTIRLTIRTTIDSVIYTNTIEKGKYVVVGPDADFKFENTCVGDTLKYTDISTPYGIPLTSWRWNFGDDTFISDTMEQNPIYLYPDAGTYEVRLKVLNENGCCSKTIKDVTINSLPKADFRFEETCQTYYTYFYDESISDSSFISKYHWDFGNDLEDTDTANVVNPLYIYDSIGDYIVKLNIVDSNLCKDNISYNLEVHPKPSADFVIIDTIPTGHIYLENRSDGAINYYWDFNYDNGESSTETNPFHQFEDDGTYKIMLVSYNDFSCPDTTYKFHEVLFTNLFVPNAFTPNSKIDELKTFKPVGVNLVKYNISIYSNWGHLVFQSSKLEDGSPAESWDGKYKGDELPNGSYLWKVSALFEDGTMWKGTDNGDGNTATSGTLMLIR